MRFATNDNLFSCPLDTRNHIAIDILIVYITVTCYTWLSSHSHMCIIKIWVHKHINQHQFFFGLQRIIELFSRNVHVLILTPLFLHTHIVCIMIVTLAQLSNSVISQYISKCISRVDNSRLQIVNGGTMTTTVHIVLSPIIQSRPLNFRYINQYGYILNFFLINEGSYVVHGPISIQIRQYLQSGIYVYIIVSSFNDNMN